MLQLIARCRAASTGFADRAAGAGSRRKKSGRPVLGLFVRPGLEPELGGRASLSSLGPQKAFEQWLKPDLTSYFGSCFEGLCREGLSDLYRREGVSSAFEIGEYWDKSVQIDLVGLRQDGWTDLGECKWGSPGALTQLAAQLERKVQGYPNQRNASIGRRLFLQRKGRSAPPGIRVHDLEDLYRAGA